MSVNLKLAHARELIRCYRRQYYDLADDTFYKAPYIEGSWGGYTAYKSMGSRIVIAYAKYDNAEQMASLIEAVRARLNVEQKRITFDVWERRIDILDHAVHADKIAKLVDNIQYGCLERAQVYLTLENSSSTDIVYDANEESFAHRLRYELTHEEDVLRDITWLEWFQPQILRLMEAIAE